MHKIFISNIRRFMRVFINEPINGWELLIAFIKGTYYIIFYRIINPNVVIHFPFLAFYKVRIIGPGSVKIGKNCWAQKNVFKGLTIVTLSKKAKVFIGEDCALGGLTIRCFDEVKIGDRVLIGNSLIQDVPFCEIGMVKSLYGRDKITPLPISVGNNVWIGMGTCILSGTIISDDSTMSVGSFSYNIEINEYCLSSGNPIIRSVQIDNILNLLK